MSAESLNTCTLSGNLGNEAEVRHTNSGLAVTSFSLAVNRRRKQQDGSYADETSWVSCKIFGKRGEAMRDNGYLQKGAKIAIVGHLHMSQWESEGQRQQKLEVIVDNIIGMTNYRQQQHPQVEQAYQAQPQQQAAAGFAAPGLYDEDIPF